MPNVVFSDERTNLEIKKVNFTKKFAKHQTQR